MVYDILYWNRYKVRNISSIKDNSVVICVGETPNFHLLTLTFMFIHIQRCANKFLSLNFFYYTCIFYLKITFFFNPLKPYDQIKTKFSWVPAMALGWSPFWYADLRSSLSKMTAVTLVLQYKTVRFQSLLLMFFCGGFVGNTKQC